jgi:Na+-transporting methylmalonyl-CoA/oxaloacetate decarboxylase gamma subunit
MIDWGLVAKVAAGGFGVTIFVLTLLSVIIWLVSLVTREPEAPGEEKK